MYVRLTFLKPLPNSIEEVRRIYNEQVVPVVRNQKGIINIRLLEPVEKTDDFISITEWESEDYAKAYENSGKYKELVGKFNDLMAKDAILKQYRVQEILTKAAR